MSYGIYIKEDGITGGDFSAGADSNPRLAGVYRPEHGGNAFVKAACVDLDCMKHTYFFTAENDAGKVRKIAELQLESLISGFGKLPCWSNFISMKCDSGTCIYVMAATAFDVPGKTFVYPVHAALFALAFRHGCIKESKNSLVLFFSGNEVISLFVSGETIVFARRFHDSGDMSANIRFSAQSVYFVKQRMLIEPDNILVISRNGGDVEKVRNAVCAKTVVEHLDVSGYFKGEELSEAERMRMVIAYGISLAPEIAPLNAWDIRNRDRKRRLNKSVFIKSVAMLLAAFPLFYAADIISNKVIIGRMDAEYKSIEPVSRRTSAAIANVGRLKAFAGSSGRNYIGPDICFDLFFAINASRGNDLKLTAAAGNPYGAVSVNGTAGSYPSLLEFMEHLRTNKAVENSELVYANSTDSGEVGFQLILKYKFAPEFRKADAGAEGAVE